MKSTITISDLRNFLRVTEGPYTLLCHPNTFEKVRETIEYVEKPGNPYHRFFEPHIKVIQDRNIEELRVGGDNWGGWQHVWDSLDEALGRDKYGQEKMS
jgi:hypothetical protein